MLGSILRYLAGHFLTAELPTVFPFGTFLVNIIGCLAIGMVFVLSQRHEWLSADLRIFPTVGFCGFTTFSAFAYENVVLLQQKDYLTFGLYSILSFVLCLAATFVGMIITKA